MAGLILGRGLKSLIYGVSPADPMILCARSEC
jgi:hypothetical protein